jgi:hypothetical protein
MFAQLIDPEIVIAKLEAKHGAESKAPQHHLGDERPYALRLAHQFVYIHQPVKQTTRPGEPSADAGR